MMNESKEAPSVGLGKLLTVFHGSVDAVVLAVEKPASRWFRTRAVRKRRTQKPGQFLYNERSFGKGACLQVHIHVSCLYVDVVIFGKPSFPIVEAVRRQGSAHENPPAKASWQFQFAGRIKHRSR